MDAGRPPPSRPPPHSPVRSLMTWCLWSLLSTQRPTVSLICLSGAKIHSVHKRAVFNRSGGGGAGTGGGVKHMFTDRPQSKDIEKKWRPTGERIRKFRLVCINATLVMERLCPGVRPLRSMALSTYLGLFVCRCPAMTQSRRTEAGLELSRASLSQFLSNANPSASPCIGSERCARSKTEPKWPL